MLKKAIKKAHPQLVPEMGRVYVVPLKFKECDRHPLKILTHPYLNAITSVPFPPTEVSGNLSKGVDT